MVSTYATGIPPKQMSWTFMCSGGLPTARSSTMAGIDYRVPGIIDPVTQPSPMSCWAAMFTMMYSWRRQVSIGIRDAVATLGQRYLECFDKDTGLPIEENRNLAQTGGLVAEPLVNPTIEGWLSRLRAYGLLWTSYGWQVMDQTGLVEVRAGRHIIIIVGMTGDGTADATNVQYVDPSDGRFHDMSAATFIRQHETGFTLRPLSDQQLGQFSQIMHYPAPLRFPGT
jgi:hypothetical protein